MTPKRPILRYHGGKWILAPWVISAFPAHKAYVEPFGGAASVLLRKDRSYAEVYNDLDSEIVNLFKIVRDNGAELKRLLILTPYAREDYLEAWEPCEDRIEQARRTVIRAFMGFASASVTKGRAPANGQRGVKADTGFRSNSNRSGSTPAHDWESYPEALDAIIARLRGVVIENRPALEVIAQHDSPNTLFYLDPPYVAGSRDRGSDYMHEMNDEDHRALAAAVHEVKGMVVLSGYPSPLYDELYGDWHKIEKAALANGSSPRTEVLWVSKNSVVQNILDL